MKDLVLITGCSSGIGEAAVKQLSLSGYSVIAGVRKQSDFAKIQKISCTPIILDVTNPEHIRSAVKLVRSLLKEGQKLSLINNAGIAIAGPIEGVSMSDWRKQFDVNFFGLVELTRELCADIRKTKGTIINIGSVSGLVTLPFLGPYAATKYALEAFSDALRRETYGFGMNVCLIEPGPIKTPIWEKGFSNKNETEINLSDEVREVYKKKYKKFFKMAQKSAIDAIEVNRVVEVILSILTSKKPRPRYLIASTSSKLGVHLARYIPDKWLDGLIG
ncbi:MAG: SDR family oxidoreductase [Oligoflexia bacterium]|nr:SDR family oxidoreductase [Oligoflexia bacterium]